MYRLETNAKADMIGWRPKKNAHYLTPTGTSKIESYGKYNPSVQVMFCVSEQRIVQQQWVFVGSTDSQAPSLAPCLTHCISN